MRRFLTLTLALGLLTGLPVSGFAQSTLDTIRSTSRIKLGYRENTPPFSFVEDRQAAGYSVDLCKVVAQSVQKQLELDELQIDWIPVTAEQRMDDVASGKVDIECGATTNTLSRQEKVDFSLITFVTGGSFVTLKASNVTTSSDLNGKRIAVTKGTTTEKALEKYLWLKLVQADVRPVESHEVGMKMLDSGEIDAYAADQVVLRGQVLKVADRDKYTLAEDLFSYEPYGLVIRRGDPDFRLAVNRALAKTFGTNQILALYRKWFGEFEMEPNPLLLAVFRIQALPE